MQPLLAMPAGGVKWLVPALLISVVMDLIFAMILAVALEDGALVGLIFAVSGVPAVLIIALVIPVRYEIWPQKLSLVFLFRRRWDVLFSTIESAEEARRWQPYAAAGVRFATSQAQAIIVKRRNMRLLGRPNIVFSPQDRGVFLPRLQQALAQDPERHIAEVERMNA